MISMPSLTMQEKRFHPYPGWPMFVFLPLVLVFGVVQIVYTSIFFSPDAMLISVPLLVVSVLTFIFGMFGFQAVAPNSSRVLLLFGTYLAIRFAIIIT